MENGGGQRFPGLAGNQVLSPAGWVTDKVIYSPANAWAPSKPEYRRQIFGYFEGLTFAFVAHEDKSRVMVDFNPPAE